MVGREGSAWANITVIALHLPCIQMRLIYNKQPARPILDGGNLLLFLSRLFRQYLKMGYWELLLEISNKLLDTCCSNQSGKFKEGRKKSPEAGAKNSFLCFLFQRENPPSASDAFWHLRYSRRIHLRKKEVQSSKLLLWLMPSISSPPASPLRQ